MPGEDRGGDHGRGFQESVVGAGKTGLSGGVRLSAREGANGERAVRGMALARGPDVAVREKARARGLNSADRWGRQISGSVRVRGSRLELGGGSWA